MNSAPGRVLAKKAPGRRRPGVSLIEHGIALISQIGSGCKLLAGDYSQNGTTLARASAPSLPSRGRGSFFQRPP
jgi:hypothetical protein